MTLAAEPLTIPALAAILLPADSACSGAWPAALLEICCATFFGCCGPGWICACDRATKTSGDHVDLCCRSPGGFAHTCPNDDHPCTDWSSNSSTCHGCLDHCDDHPDRTSKIVLCPDIHDRYDRGDPCPCSACYRTDRANCSDRGASPNFSSPLTSSHVWTPTGDPATARADPSESL